MQVFANLEFKNSGPILEFTSSFPTNPINGQMALVDGIVYIYTTLSGVSTWYPLSNESTYFTHTQGISSTEWTITHNLNTSNFIFFCYDSNNNLVSPIYHYVDDNTFKLEFTSAIMGKVVVFVAADRYAPTFISDTMNVKHIINGNTGTEAIQLMPDGTIEFTGNLVPSTGDTFTIGTVDKPVKDLYVGANSLYVNGQQVLSNSSTTMTFSADPDQNIGIQASGTGNISLSTTSDGDIEINPQGTGVIQAKGTVQVTAGEKIISSDGNDVVFDRIKVLNGISLGSEEIVDKTYIDTQDSELSGRIDSNDTDISDLGAIKADKSYVDSLVTGLDMKQSVTVSTTGNISLSGTQTIDGVSVQIGDRVLVKNQTDATKNGIYVVDSSTWSRSSDADNNSGSEVSGGMYCFVESGTVNANTGWTLASPGGDVILGTDDLTFAKFSNSIMSASDVLTKIKTVDGPGSGLDADLLDGYDSSYFSTKAYADTKLNSSSYTASDILAKIKTVDGSGSGLDADLLDGIQSNELVKKTALDTGVVYLPSGTTAERPTLSSSQQAIRYNTDLLSFEGWDGVSWSGLGGGATGGGTDKVFQLNDQVVTADYTIPAGQNAMSAGPVTIADGVVVSVPDGSTWTII